MAVGLLVCGRVDPLDQPIEQLAVHRLGQGVARVEGFARVEGDQCLFSGHFNRAESDRFRERGRRHFEQFGGHLERLGTRHLGALRRTHALGPEAHGTQVQNGGDRVKGPRLLVAGETCLFANKLHVTVTRKYIVRV